ncbi:MAG: class B sortase [Lachnospiraceae bacterium]|nr:class B sortase [Lachnospiraceae bacterium]
MLLLVIAVAGVGAGIYIEGRGTEKPENETGSAEKEEAPGDQVRSNSGLARTNGSAEETAEDVQIDFSALRERNPDIFAWIHIPGTSVDYPVLQSGQSDTYYESHNAYREEDDAGAVYIELANLTSMCDFNTVLHGKAGADGNGLFADLYRFADSEFFADHEYVYLYLDGNVLVYEIFAAYERENTSLIRTYDFTYLSGCRQFLDDLYGTREMGMNLREGWENVNEYNYVITLTAQEEGEEHQFVVLAVLIQDTAGTINRVVTE